MRTCPRCGYVDPAAVAAGRAHDAKKRPKRDRAAYFRKRRKKEKKSERKG